MAKEITHEPRKVQSSRKYRFCVKITEKKYKWRYCYSKEEIKILKEEKDALKVNKSQNCTDLGSGKQTKTQL